MAPDINNLVVPLRPEGIIKTYHHLGVKASGHRGISLHNSRLFLGRCYIKQIWQCLDVMLLRDRPLVRKMRSSGHARFRRLSLQEESTTLAVCLSDVEVLANSVD